MVGYPAHVNVLVIVQISLNLSLPALLTCF